MHRARHILQLNEELLNQMNAYAKLMKGSLRLGLINGLQCINFGAMLAAFVQKYPDISLSIRNFGSYQLLDMLLERQIDAAFINQPLRNISSSLNFQELGEDHFVLAVPITHHLAGRKSVSLKELAGERFIFHQPWHATSEIIAGFEPNIICRAGEPQTGFYLVQGGMGITFFPSLEFKTLPSKKVCILELNEPITKKVGVAWRNDTNSPLIRAITDFAMKWCSNRQKQ